MAKIDTKDLFNRAEELRSERAATLEAQRANREVLRNLQISGMLTEDEEDMLDDYYPVRTRERGDSAEEGE